MRFQQRPLSHTPKPFNRSGTDMIFIETKSESIFYNLASEYYFATEHTFPEDIFMLWKASPSLVIGKYQNTLEEIDSAYAKERGITVVRRMSGGGTCYLDPGGWQFAFITREVGLEIEFKRFVDPVIKVLRSLGVEAELSGRNDIMVSGKKISGNSQYRLGPATVHHGTLLFDSDLDELQRATTPKEYKITSKAIKSVRERVTNIREHLPRDMTSDEFKKALAGGISDSEYCISKEDHKRICEIAEAQFADPKIIYASSPKFEIEKTIHLPGGEFNLGFTVNKGKIISSGITGDFFAEVSAEDIAGALIGSEYTPEAVEKALSQFDGKLFRASAKELTEGIFT